MGKVAVITDSTGFIPTDVTRNLPIFYIPLHIIWGSENFLDLVTITSDEFYQRLKTSKELPTTSQPSPAAFRDKYTQLLDQGYDILSIHISSKLSGTLDSAIQAKNFLPGAHIEIVDSGTTSMHLGFQVLAAARLAAQGATLQECKATAERAREHSGVYFVLNTLEYLHRGGRIGGAAALVGTVLTLKPILELRGGRVEPVERIRTAAKARDRMIELFQKRVETERRPVRIATLYSDTPELAQELLDKARQKLGVSEVSETIIGTVPPVLGVYAGPGALGIAFMMGM